MRPLVASDSSAANFAATAAETASRPILASKHSPPSGCPSTRRDRRACRFYIRAGKRMRLTATEVRVEFKLPLQAGFDTASAREADYIRFRLSPTVTISLGAEVKLPGEAMVGEAVELLVRHDGGR
jgi:hypothetical protein